MALGVLVDANVLYSRTLRDWLFLLKLRSEAGMFTVYATEDIIAEVLYRLRRDNPNEPGHFIAGIHDRIVANIDDRTHRTSHGCGGGHSQVVAAGRECDLVECLGEVVL
ncbi:MAG: hypothetical protein WBP28_00340 [Nostocoides sp.]